MSTTQDTFRGPHEERPDWLIAYLLWLLTGIFGGHRFYFGRYLSAVVMLGLWAGAILMVSETAGLVLGTVVAGVWVVDGIRMPFWIYRSNRSGMVA